MPWISKSFIHTAKEKHYERHGTALQKLSGLLRPAKAAGPEDNQSISD